MSIWCYVLYIAVTAAIFYKIVRKMHKIKSPKFFGMRASEVFSAHRDIFLQKFAKLKNLGLATGIKLFGSIARGKDREDSDIDLLVFVHEASPSVFAKVTTILCDWIYFPVHVTLTDGNNYVPVHILETSVEL